MQDVRRADDLRPATAAEWHAAWAMKAVELGARDPYTVRVRQAAALICAVLASGYAARRVPNWCTWSDPVAGHIGVPRGAHKAGPARALAHVAITEAGLHERRPHHRYAEAEALIRLGWYPIGWSPVPASWLTMASRRAIDLLNRIAAQRAWFYGCRTMPGGFSTMVRERATAALSREPTRLCDINWRAAYRRAAERLRSGWLP